jgi:hypothetical protein
MEELAEHYAAGRLEHEEYVERLDAAATARTALDLAVLFEDLPRPANPLLSAEGRTSLAPVRRRRGVPWLLLLVIAITLAVLTDFPWILVAVAAVAWTVFGQRGRSHRC